MFVRRMSNYADPNSWGSCRRRRRASRLRAMIEHRYAVSGKVSIVDLGGEERYWRIFDAEWLRAHRVRITLLNRYEEYLPRDADPRIFDRAIADCCDLSGFADRSFDIAHSNSVIEHVGSWRRMERFALEARRIGCNYFIQTPNFAFPIEPHFGSLGFHWLPEPMRVYIVMRHAMGNFPRADTFRCAHDFVQDVHLLTRLQFATLFPDAEITSERLLGLTKSFVAVR